MKRKWVITLAAVLAACAVASATQLTQIFVTEDTEIQDVEETGLQMSEELKAEIEERRSVIEEAMADSGADLGDKFSMMVSALDATIENPVEYNDIIYNYEYLRTAHKLSNEQLDYISDMIIKGYRAMDIMDIAYFWLDTNEDISIVEDIYKILDRFMGNNRIENAFNYVTGDKCGVLDEEDVENYLKEGLTIEDITTANVLCRKGVYTIQEILEMRKESKTFAEIAAEIEGVSSEELPQEATVMMQSAAVMSVDAEVESAEVEPEEIEAVSPENVLIAEMLTEIEGGSLGEYYTQAIDGENLEEKLIETQDRYGDEIVSDLRTRGIYKTATREEKEEYQARLEEGR